MSSLIWRSWPRITLEQSQILYNHFAKQGPVIGFRSARKHLKGAIGQGIVVFEDTETVQSLLKGHESVELDLKHLFEPATKSQTDATLDASDAAHDVSTEAEKPSQWIVKINNNHKSPETVSIETMLAKRKLKVAKEGTLFENFIKEGLNFRSKVHDDEKQFIKGLLDQKLLDIREIEEARGRKPYKRSTDAQSLNPSADAPEMSKQEDSEMAEPAVLETSSAAMPTISETSKPDHTKEESAKQEA